MSEQQQNPDRPQQPGQPYAQPGQPLSLIHI